MDFTRENDIFNDNYNSSFSSKKANKIYSIKRYYTYKELTEEMKEFLRFGLQILTKVKVFTDFDYKVFYLHQIEKKKQQEIADLLDSTIDIVKKVTPRVRKNIAQKSYLVKAAFFGESIKELLEELNYSEWALKEGGLQKAQSKIYEKYGEAPDCEMRLKIDNYHDSFMEKHLKDYSNVLNVVSELKQDTKYIELTKKLQIIEHSIEYIEWNKHVDEEREHINSKIQEEFIRIKYNTNIQELRNVISTKASLLVNQPKEVIFYLWGYMQLDWMKLDKQWLE